MEKGTHIYYAYLRNSTDGQDFSSKVQRREILRAFSAVTESFHDAGVSSAAIIDNRPALGDSASDGAWDDAGVGENGSSLQMFDNTEFCRPSIPSENHG
jgi:hypothetical protein